MWRTNYVYYINVARATQSIFFGQQLISYQKYILQITQPSQYWYTRGTLIWQAWKKGDGVHASSIYKYMCCILYIYINRRANGIYIYIGGRYIHIYFPKSCNLWTVSPCFYFLSIKHNQRPTNLKLLHYFTLGINDISSKQLTVK